MAKTMTEQELWTMIKRKLEDQGIALDNLLEIIANSPNADVKVVCAGAGDLAHSLEALACATRDQVVMVRVDEQTTRQLDLWVETGAVRSRSEAAALFVREGLELRARELEQLNGAISEVKKAKAKLQQQAGKILGTGNTE